MDLRNTRVNRNECAPNCSEEDDAKEEVANGACRHALSDTARGCRVLSAAATDRGEIIATNVDDIRLRVAMAIILNL